MAINRSKNLLVLLLFVSLLLHLFVFVVLSREYVWSRRVQASRSPRFHVVSVEQPKKELPFRSKSRFLSDANRKESGVGNLGKAPLLRRADRNFIPSRRGGLSPETRVLPIAIKPLLSTPAVPRPPPVPTTPVPKWSVLSKEPKPPSEKTTGPKKPPAPENSRDFLPERLKATTPAPLKPPEALEPKVAPKVERKPGKKSPKPRPVVTNEVKPELAVRRQARSKSEEKEPPRQKGKVEAREKPKKSAVAALRPNPQPRRPQRLAPRRPQPEDPLALFRVKPQPKGKPNAPRLALSDEEADRIAKASSEKDLEKEAGEIISLDTRDFRYAAYFAHIKRKIQNAWEWPLEARRYGGRLSLRFVLRENGALEEVRLLKSSRVPILDDLAMAAVTKAAPFRPFPAGVKRKTIEATFIYARP